MKLGIQPRNLNFSPKTKTEDLHLSDVAETQNLMREAFPIEQHGSVKNILWEAYRHLTKWASAHKEKQPSQRRIRSLWDGDAARVNGWEKDGLRDARQKQQRRELRQKFNDIANHLERQDAGHYSATIAAMRSAADDLVGENSALDGR